jgi:arylformamidase
LDVQLIEDQKNNHFSLPNELADPESSMFKRVMAMIQSQG